MYLSLWCTCSSSQYNAENSAISATEAELIAATSNAGYDVC